MLRSSAGPPSVARRALSAAFRLPASTAALSASRHACSAPMRLRGEDGEEPVAQELQYLAAPLRDGVADAFEMLIEPANDFRARVAVDESGEATKIGEQQCRRDDLAVAASDHALHHVGPGLRTEIGPQGLDRNVRQADSIGDKAQGREDATDSREFVLGEAAGTVGCHGEHRAAEARCDPG